MTFLVDYSFDGIIDGAIVLIANPGSCRPYAAWINGVIEELIDPPVLNIAASSEPQQVEALELSVATSLDELLLAAA